MKLFRSALIFALLGFAGTARLEAGILVDHQPLNSGGPSADTDFRTNFGDPYWQLLADDFNLSAAATVHHVRWWGFYGNNFSDDSVLPPPGDESMRVRFYDDTGDEGLPGNILYEETLLNPSRQATGRVVSATRLHPEFVYESVLPVPFEAAAYTRYWMEIVQVGIPTSVFRWEFSYAPGDTEAFINPDVSVWTFRPGVNLAFQLSQIPEPATGVLMVVLTTVPCASARKRKHRSVVHQKISWGVVI
jgi:hypothetical protein